MMEQSLWDALRVGRRLLEKISSVADRLEYAFLKRKAAADLLVGVNMLDREQQEYAAKRMSPVFVLSTGRCGTQTLSRVMGLSPLIEAHHEPQPSLFEASYFAYILKNQRLVSEQFWSDLIRNERDFPIYLAQRKGKVYFESNNRLTFLAKALQTRYPSSQFIHLARHPYWFIRSAMRRQYFNGHNWDFARIHPVVGDSFYERWAGADQLEKCAWLWQQTNRHILDFNKTLHISQTVFIKAEELFAGREEIIEQVYHFVHNVPVPSSGSIQKVLQQKYNKQTAGDFPAPPRWSAIQVDRVKHLVSAIAQKLGYEL